MELYPHQRTGVDWLLHEADANAGLFDDQGLGKTVIVLAALAEEDPELPVLVLAPAVVLWNWHDEALVWWAGLDPADVYVVTSGTDTIPRNARLVIVSHDMMLRPGIARQLTLLRWHRVVVDECHFFRNPLAKRTLRLYHATDGVVRRATRGVWILSGTPIPNYAHELWTHLHALAPRRITVDGAVLTFSQFATRFCRFRRTPYDVQVVGHRRVAELRQRLHGFALRRTKADELDLPPVRWEELRISPRDLPSAALDDLHAAARAFTPQVTAAMASPTADPLAVARAASDELAVYRRLCGVLKAGVLADRLEFELDNGLDNVVVLGWHTDVLDRIEAGLAQHGVVRIDGSTPAATRRALVKKFQEGRARVALCNILAGGVGVTLTAACEVVFAELSYVPGDNAQAADRVNRIGQTRPMRIRVASLVGSVDELIGRVLVRKTRSIREVMQ